MMTQNKKILIWGTVVLGGLSLGLFLWLRGKDKTKGKSKRSSAAKKKGGNSVFEPDTATPFDMNYSQQVEKWMSPKAIERLDESKGKRLAKRIRQAKGSKWFGNDDEAVIEVIFGKQLPDKVAVSDLSRYFYALYKTDLWNFLQSFLKPSEMQQLIQKPIRNKANYTLKFPQK